MPLSKQQTIILKMAVILMINVRQTQVFFSIWKCMSVYRAVQRLHIVCLYLHCQPGVRGWRPAKCKALGQCHDG